jgi:hypothetical protein
MASKKPSTSKSENGNRSGRLRFVAMPHSWEIGTWPADVWPHDSKRGQWIARAYRKELMQAGAISRIGAKLIFIGARYTAWIERRADRVGDYQSNNPEIGKRHEARLAREA